MRHLILHIFLCVLIGLVYTKTETYLSVRLVTWNAGDERPDKVDFKPILGVKERNKPDVIVIGLEELEDESDWKAGIQKTLSAHNYVKLGGQDMGAILELVYVKSSIKPRIKNVMSTYKGTGILGIWHNKGGVSVRFDLHQKSFVFVNSHLAAGQDNVQDRIDDYNQILKKHYFKHDTTPYILDHDYVFWQGDLNFRVEGITKASAEQMIPEFLPKLLEYDQLKKTVSAGKAFQGFGEAGIQFAPTYKFDKGTNRYDTSSKQRIPSWTDRILYRTHPDKKGLAVDPAKYQSLHDVTVSDHKPVVLTCNVLL